ncbi:Hypothetical protein CINCED_3A008488 [Cinara cedri]|uniref:Uncharacterized protein n=1 Tax=Cinara cedri TaxID=506608 RepID=A0A5E4M6V4_9HEMI|nr:Hypothetical protein CINCED_3A008488 [Cinara cedri]
MDAVKLEAKWPPDGNHRVAIGASEFGIYKEPDSGKQPVGADDKATGIMLVLSLMAAVAIVLYFTFSDYTIPTTQAAFTGPAMSYAKYAKDKQLTTITTDPVVRKSDGLLYAVLGLQNAENYTTTCSPTIGEDVVTAANRLDDNGRLEYGRRMRLYPTTFKTQRPTDDVHPGSVRFPNYQKNAMDSELKYHSDSVYGFGKRSDFPQLTAYQAPFPPKSILDVMKYVTTVGSPPRKFDVPVEEYMTAQESKTRYVPIRAAEEVNRLLPDMVAPTSDPTRRFRNKFGPPFIYTPKPPVMALPDDFMKPPDPDAHFSVNFEKDAVPMADLTVQEESANFPSHTGVVFHHPPSLTDLVYHSSTTENIYPEPDVTTPRTIIKKNRRKKNQKPISVMLDIYPLSDNEDEDDEDHSDEKDGDSEVQHTSTNRQSDRDKLLLRLNLFPHFSKTNRKISRFLEQEKLRDRQMPLIHLSTRILQDGENYVSGENDKSSDYEYTSESKNVENLSKIQ